MKTLDYWSLFLHAFLYKYIYMYIIYYEKDYCLVLAEAIF